MKDFFAHFGLTLLIAFADFIFIFVSSFMSVNKWRIEEAYVVGFVINALMLSVVLSCLILD